MRIKKICVIANYYPTDTDPIYSFLDEVVSEFADNSVECHVITALSKSEKKHVANDRTKITKQGNAVHIYCPRYKVFPSRKIGNLNTVRFSGLSYYRAIYKVFKKHIGTCDVIYAHFLSLAGICASMLGKKLGIPCVVACGESSFEPAMLTYNEFKKEIYNISGFVTVSSQINKELRELGFVKDDTKIVVLPNSVDKEKFYQQDRLACREELNIPSDKFIISFVGHFIERKGIHEIIDAINSLDDVYALFVGDKELPKECKNILFVGKVPHDKLALYYNASDVFVLPTKNEGCCNAIVEAQSCGLPIISTDAPFNYDILNKDSAIFINPTSKDEIAQAIKLLRDDIELRNNLSKASLILSVNRGIKERAKLILNFMDNIYE